MNILFKILTCIAKTKICCRTYLKNNDVYNEKDIITFNYSTNNKNYYIFKKNISSILVNYGFLVIEYVDHNTSINIDINNPKCFYMITDNTIFDYDFVKWYLLKFHNYKVANSYEIIIIDDNAETIKINQTNSITLNKDNYHVNTEECAS